MEKISIRKLYKTLKQKLKWRFLVRAFLICFHVVPALSLTNYLYALKRRNPEKFYSILSSMIVASIITAVGSVLLIFSVKLFFPTSLLSYFFDSFWGSIRPYNLPPLPDISIDDTSFSEEVKDYKEEKKTHEKSNKSNREIVYICLFFICYIIFMAGGKD